jgi:hypothetical protein
VAEDVASEVFSNGVGSEFVEESGSGLFAGLFFGGVVFVVGCAEWERVVVVSFLWVGIGSYLHICG